MYYADEKVLVADQLRIHTRILYNFPVARFLFLELYVFILENDD
jgi:hypothetical protein